MNNVSQRLQRAQTILQHQKYLRNASVAGAIDRVIITNTFVSLMNADIPTLKPRYGRAMAVSTADREATTPIRTTQGTADGLPPL